MKKVVSLFIFIFMVLNASTTLAVPPHHGYGPAYYRPPVHHYHGYYRHDRWYDFLGYIPPISITYSKGEPAVNQQQYINVNTYGYNRTAVPMVIYSDYYYDCSTYNYINCNDPHYQRCFQCRGTR